MTDQAQPPLRADHERSRQILGGFFLGSLVVLMGLLGYFLIAMVGPMTQPSPFFTGLTEQYERKVASAAGEKAGGKEREPETDELTVDLAVILEYAAADIRTAQVQIAFSLVAGLFFSGVGVLLFTAGITGALQLKASHEQSQFELATAAPGIVCILLGAAIVSLGVTKDVRRPLDAQVKRPIGVESRTGTRPPPTTSTGEPAARDRIRPEVPEGVPIPRGGSPAQP